MDDRGRLRRTISGKKKRPRPLCVGRGRVRGSTTQIADHAPQRDNHNPHPPKKQPATSTYPAPPARYSTTIRNPIGGGPPPPVTTPDQKMETIILFVVFVVFGLGAIAPIVADDESVRPEPPTPNRNEK